MTAGNRSDQCKKLLMSRVLLKSQLATLYRIRSDVFNENFFFSSFRYILCCVRFRRFWSSFFLFSNFSDAFHRLISWNKLNLSRGKETRSQIVASITDVNLIWGAGLNNIMHFIPKLLA